MHHVHYSKSLWRYNQFPPVKRFFILVTCIARCFFSDTIRAHFVRFLTTRNTMGNTVYRSGFVAFIFCCPILFAAENRTWKDDTGLFSIEASLEQIDGNSVKLKKTDGTSITLPVSKLSEADRQYIANLSTQNPFGNSGNTAAPSPQRQPSGIATQQPKLSFASFTGLAVQTVDISQTREAIGIVPNVWAGEVDPAPPSEQSSEITRLVFRFQDVPTNTQPRRTDFFIVGNTAVTAFHFAVDILGRTPEKNFTRIALGSTDTGDTMMQDSPLKLQPLGISPNGKRVLFHQEPWDSPPFGKRTFVHLAEITEQGWTAVATFEPFAQLKSTDNRASSGIEADVYWATWADNEHVLVQSERGTLILLNVDTGKAIWKTKVDGRNETTLSPGRKYCFIPTGGKAILCETMTGKAVGSVSNVPSQKMRFSPDGKRFATCNEQGITLGDAATGKLDTPFFVSESSRTQQFFWVDDRYLLLGGNLIDAARKITVWTYTGLQSNFKLVDGYCWYTFGSSRQGIYLTAVIIPHFDMSVLGISTDNETDLALKQGSEVAVVLEDSIAKDRGEVRKSIEKKIADNGWKISDTAAVSIVLKIKEEKEDTTSYTAGGTFPFSPIPRPMSRMQMQGSGVEVKFQPERYCLSIMQGEKEIWGKNHLTRPPSQLPLDVVKDSSLQEVIDKEMELLNYKEWLDSLNIPKAIARKQESKGTSRVTENGIE